MKFNPHLAGEAVLGKIEYPKVALPKFNGVRGLNQIGELVARSLKPIPNLYTRKKFSGTHLHGLDGELVVGLFDDEEVFTKSTSGVMSKDGLPDVKWHIFDVFHETMPYIERLALAEEMVRHACHTGIVMVESKLVYSDAEMVEYSEWALGLGFEGLVLRDPDAKYKQGRSTDKEGSFLRFCPWHRSEAYILAIEEGQINLNESKKNELGYLKKSSHKANKVGSGQAGAITVRDCKSGLASVFNMPVPTDKLQKEMWAHPEKFIGKICKYKFKPSVKIGGKPRFSQYEGLRAPEDMS